MTSIIKSLSIRSKVALAPVVTVMCLAAIGMLGVLGVQSNQNLGGSRQPVRQVVTAGLTGPVIDIRVTAHAVQHTSAEMASGNADLSTRTENTAAALQQTASSIEQRSANIRASADNARDADQMARTASGVAQEGRQAVGDMVSTMEAIDGQAKKIGVIIGEIDGIAFQTNILALNAAKKHPLQPTR